jgi:hypothetical protein
MLSPVEFIVKVKEYCKNGQWMSLLGENEAIEKKLNDVLQNHCGNEGINLKLREGKIGEIYAKYVSNEKNWLRARIIERR